MTNKTEQSKNDWRGFRDAIVQNETDRWTEGLDKETIDRFYNKDTETKEDEDNQTQKDNSNGKK